MSTHAQMTTIATYRIALLNNPPLAEPGHGPSVTEAVSTGIVLPLSVPT